jgi:hypothetical protein
VIVGLDAPAALAGACGGGPAEQAAPSAVERARAYLEVHLEEADAPTQVLAARLAERHGVGGFERWAATGGDRLAAPEPVDGPYARAWARLTDPGLTLRREELEALPRDRPVDVVSWVVATALHCDTPGFPADWADTARRALAEDPEAGYVTTHVGLGLVALAERGCDPPGASQLRRDTVAALRAALAGADRADDLSLERVAVLAELDPGTPVDPAWRERIAAAQRPDGGLAREGPDGGGESDWHTTLLAWWVLQLLEGRGSGRPLFTP